MKNPSNHLETELVEIISSTPKAENKIHKKKRPSRKYWLTIAINCFVLAILISFTLTFRLTVKIGFICKDPKLSFPFSGETVKSWVLYTVNTVGPAVIIFFVELYVEGKFNRNLFKEWKKWYSEYFVGILYHVIIMTVFKTALPEHRPHFFDTCRPDTGTTCIPGEYVDEYQCTNKNLPYYYILDSHRSFFSGHASFAVYASVFCAWYVHRRFSSPALKTMIQPLVIMLIIIWSVICSITRITDHRHHWWDVTIGIIYGLVNALYVVIGRCNSFKTPKY